MSFKNRQKPGSSDSRSRDSSGPRKPRETSGWEASPRERFGQKKFDKKPFEGKSKVSRQPTEGGLKVIAPVSSERKASFREDRKDKPSFGRAGFKRGSGGSFGPTGDSSRTSYRAGIRSEESRDSERAPRSGEKRPYPSKRGESKPFGRGFDRKDKGGFGREGAERGRSFRSDDRFGARSRFGSAEESSSPRPYGEGRPSFGRKPFSGPREDRDEGPRARDSFRSEGKKSPGSLKIRPLDKGTEKVGEKKIEKKKLKASSAAVEAAFVAAWERLFASPIHLDSLLSKQSPVIKSELAQIIPEILMRPVSLAEALGVGVPDGEPWKLTPDKLQAWRPAHLAAQRLLSAKNLKNILSAVKVHDFPSRMVRSWSSAWGEQVVKELVEVLGARAPLSLRVYQRKNRDAILEEIKNELAGSEDALGSELQDIQPSNITPEGIRLSGYARVLGTEAFKRGDFEIQDEGSQLLARFALWPEQVAGALASQPGRVTSAQLKRLKEIHGAPKDGSLESETETAEKMAELSKKPLGKTPRIVIDACAGAGGKSLALADFLSGKGRIYSYDVSERKLSALRKRATKAGFNNLQTLALEEGKELEKIGSFREQANLVLIDAPCSGWGVLRRNPDIKWRQDEETLDRLPGVQSRLLSVYSTLVAPRGTLVFGVCTFRKEETTAVADAFEKDNPQFERIGGGYFGPGPTDGFFMVAWKKKTS